MHDEGTADFNEADNAKTKEAKLLAFYDEMSAHFKEADQMIAVGGLLI